MFPFVMPATSKKKTAVRTAPALRRAPDPAEVLEALRRQYGPVRWEPRYDPVSELVFTVLSQHTSDVNAAKAYETLLAAFGSWEAVARADPREIARSIQVGGLAQTKAPRIKAMLLRVQELRGSLDLEFLRDLPLEEAKTWLRQLPGVGPKTAAIVLCFSLGRPAMAVDTHVHRVAKRLGLIGSKVNLEQAHALLERAVAPEQVFAFHVYLITHGRRVCRAPQPRCQDCVLEPGCPSSLLRSPGAAQPPPGSARGWTGRYHVEPEDWRPPGASPKEGRYQGVEKGESRGAKPPSLP